MNCDIMKSILFLFMLLSTTATAEVRLRPELIQSGEVWSCSTPGQGVLKGRRWLPPTATPKAVLIAVHGTQTHSGWFGALAVELNHHGWAVYAPDREGSGLNLALNSKGVPQPAQATHWTEWCRSLDAAVGQVLKEQHAAGKKPPVYLLGSSWGTALVAAYMDRLAKFKGGWLPAHAAQLSGLILSVPSGLKSTVPGLPKKLETVAVGVPSQLLGKLIPPLRRLSTGIGLPKETYSKHEPTRKLVGDQDLPLPQPERTLQVGEQDPRIIHRATYGFLLQSGAMRRAANKAVKRLREVPVLSLLAEVDDIADNPALQKVLPPDSIVMLKNTEHCVQVERADLLAAEILRWHLRLP
jgi:alpha-beta hydrolase superfamily lysophospholipase